MVTTWDALIPEQVLEAGRTRPVVVACESPTEFADPARARFVAKFAGLPEVTPALWCRELVGNLLAQALGVLVPTPAVIDASPAFVTGTKSFFDARGLVIQSGACFGTSYVPGLANVTKQTTDVPERFDEGPRGSTLSTC